MEHCYGLNTSSDEPPHLLWFNNDALTIIRKHHQEFKENLKYRLQKNLIHCENCGRWTATPHIDDPDTMTYRCHRKLDLQFHVTLHVQGLSGRVHAYLRDMDTSPITTVIPIDLETEHGRSVVDLWLCHWSGFLRWLQK